MLIIRRPLLFLIYDAPGLTKITLDNKNGDFSILMRTQTLWTFWKQARSNGFQLKMRLRLLDKRFWRKVSTKANNESERPKKKNEMHPILYLFDLFCEVYVLLYLQMQLRIVELYLVLLVSFLELLGERFYKERDSVPEFSTYQRQG